MTTTLKSFGLLVALAMSNSCFCADVDTLVLNPTPKNTECKSAQINIDDELVKAELCVAQGSFSSDLYSLKFNGKLVLKGIDDQTTAGINAAYKNKSVVLQCTPQLVRGNATPEDVRKIVPSYTDAKVAELVNLMKGAAMPVEVGRLCLITFEQTVVLKGQVFF